MNRVTLKGLLRSKYLHDSQCTYIHKIYMSEFIKINIVFMGILFHFEKGYYEVLSQTFGLLKTGFTCIQIMYHLLLSLIL